MRNLNLALVLLPTLATAQGTYDFQIDTGATSFTWSGTTSVGDINENPANFTLAGTTQLQMSGGGSPVGSAAFVGGDAALQPDLAGTIPGPFGTTLASLSVSNAHVKLQSGTFSVDAAGNFTADVSIEMISGQVAVSSIFGNSNTDLAGSVSAPTSTSGTLQGTATGYQLSMPVSGSFPFADPGTGITATITLNGTLVANSSYPVPSAYCAGSPNSVGAGAAIGTGGSPSLGNADLTLTCQGLPPNQPGLYFYGPNQVSVPFGNGVRCVGGTLVRLSPQNSGPSGVANRVIDGSSLPVPITAGQTRNFQFWYRDPAAGGAFFNLSGAVSVEFTP